MPTESEGWSGEVSATPLRDQRLAAARKLTVFAPAPHACQPPSQAVCLLGLTSYTQLHLADRRLASHAAQGLGTGCHQQQGRHPVMDGARKPRAKQGWHPVLDDNPWRGECLCWHSPLWCLWQRPKSQHTPAVTHNFSTGGGSDTLEADAAVCRSPHTTAQRRHLACTGGGRGCTVQVSRCCIGGMPYPSAGVTTSANLMVG